MLASGLVRRDQNLTSCVFHALLPVQVDEDEALQRLVAAADGDAAVGVLPGTGDSGTPLLHRANADHNTVRHYVPYGTFSSYLFHFSSFNSLIKVKCRVGL